MTARLVHVDEAGPGDSGRNRRTGARRDGGQQPGAHGEPDGPVDLGDLDEAVPVEPIVAPVQHHVHRHMGRQPASEREDGPPGEQPQSRPRQGMVGDEHLR